MNLGQNLSPGLAISIAAAAVTSAGTAVDGTAIDMQGYEGVVFFCDVGTANAGNFLKASQSELSGSGFDDLAGSKVVASANANIVMLEVHRPEKRYVKPHLIRAGANTTAGQIYAIRYGAMKAPVSQSTVDRGIVNGPAEGTA